MRQLSDLRFETHAHMKSIIGQDLITDDNAAIIELVKNSMDADASKITVSFRSADCECDHAEISVLDNGSGMSREDIERKWLNLAFSSKRGSRDRLYAGRKGIGRFSSDKLGRDLIMYTKHEGASGIIKVMVDWESFESKDGWEAKLREIGFKCFELSESEFRSETGIYDFASGTCLRIKRLKSLWEPKKLLGLKRDLQRFMLPSQVDAGSGAKIFIGILDYNDHSNLPELAGEVGNMAFEKLQVKASYIESRIDKKGSRIKTKLYYRGESLVKFIEKNNFETLKNAKITLFHMNQHNKALFKMETGVASEEYGSVFLYLNGFRVSPYGEPQNDWLGIDARRGRSSKRRFGTRDLIGRIEVEDHTGENFEAPSDREGMQQSKALSQLQGISSGFFGHALEMLERFVVYGLSWDSADKHCGGIEQHLSNHSKNFDGSMKKSSLSEREKDSNIVKELSMILVQKSRKSDILSIKFGNKALEILGRQRQKDIEKFEKTLDRMASGSDVEILHFTPMEVIETLEKSEAKALRLEAENNSLREGNFSIDKRIKNERRRRIFAESKKGSDSQKLIEVIHAGGNWCANVEYSLRTFLKKIKGDPSAIGNKLFDKTAEAHMLAMRLNKLPSLIWSANFEVTGEAERIDVFSYIRDYIENIVGDGIYNFGLEVSFENKKNSCLILDIQPIDLSLMIDNIVRNAWLRSADRVDVLVEEFDGKFKLNFVDDGNEGTDASTRGKLLEAGVPPDDVMNTGFYLHARTILENLGASLSIKDNHEKGVTVKLEWKKQKA